MVSLDRSSSASAGWDATARIKSAAPHPFPGPNSPPLAHINPGVSRSVSRVAPRPPFHPASCRMKCVLPRDRHPPWGRTPRPSRRGTACRATGSLYSWIRSTVQLVFILYCFTTMLVVVLLLWVLSSTQRVNCVVDSLT